MGALTHLIRFLSCETQKKMYAAPLA